MAFTHNRNLNRNLKYYRTYGVKLRNVVRRLKMFSTRSSYIPNTTNLLKTYRVSFNIYYPRFRMYWTDSLLRHRLSRRLLILLTGLHTTCFYHRTVLTVWNNLNNLKLLFNRYVYHQFWRWGRGRAKPFYNALLLNFRRSRFFPNLHSTRGRTYVSASLGMFAKMFNKGKSFIKNKLVYLTLAGFLRKILIFTDIQELLVFVKGLPLYLTEIFTTINTPVIADYTHPFNDELVTEDRISYHFFAPYFIFIRSKSYSFMKVKKRGRIKRKLTKRLIKLNRKVD